MNAKIICTCMKCGKNFEVDENSIIKVFFRGDPIFLGNYPKYCDKCTTFNIVEKVGDLITKAVQHGKK